MSRPAFGFNAINHGLESWDTEIDTNFDTVDDFFLTNPVPLTEHTGDETDLASTFDPTLFDRSVIWVDHTTKGWLLFHSDGTTWSPLAREGAAVADLSQTITGPSIAEVQAISDKVDELLGVLRGNGTIA